MTYFINEIKPYCSYAVLVPMVSPSIEYKHVVQQILCSGIY